jgi:hypothetical protein
MAQSALYVAITNHGFGHAVRAASVAAAVQALDPGITLVMATTAPSWLLESYISGPFIYHPCVLDVGVVQADSLKMDKEATLEKLEQIRGRQQQILDDEVEFMHHHQVKLVLGDIPPLSGAIAQAAGVPGWMMGNFGWDFIYRAWGREFNDISDWIESCFAQSQYLFRLPLHEPMSSFPKVYDVGLTGGNPRYSLAELQHVFPWSAPPEKTVLLTFGGLGLEAIPYQNLAHFPDWQFISFDANAPVLPNLIQVAGNDSGNGLRQRLYRPVDFMPFCRRVVSKPGYSTFSEAMRLGVPIISLTRSGFAESPILLEGLRNYSEHLILEQADFFEGNWEFLHQPLQAPQRSESLDPEGSEAIALAIVDYFQNL